MQECGHSPGCCDTKVPPFPSHPPHEKKASTYGHFGNRLVKGSQRGVTAWWHQGTASLPRGGWWRVEARGDCSWPHGSERVQGCLCHSEWGYPKNTQVGSSRCGTGLRRRGSDGWHRRQTWPGWWRSCKHSGGLAREEEGKGEAGFGVPGSLGNIAPGTRVMEGRTHGLSRGADRK